MSHVPFPKYMFMLVGGGAEGEQEMGKAVYLLLRESLHDCK